MSAIRVELQLEDGSFTSRMLHAGQSVRQLQNDIGQGITSIRSMERESSSFLRTLGAATLAIGAASATLGLLRGTANGLVGDLVRVNAEFERMNQVLRGMSTAADPIRDAAQQVKFLREFATQAPFSLKALTDVFVRMKATGIDPMAGAMRSLVDAVAASGGTEQQLGRAALAISQMSGKGVIQMEELRQQLGEAIPRATELMARSMGVTYADLVQKISTGMVQAKPALEALNLEFNRVFGGAAQAQMNTFNGLLNQTRTQISNLALAAGDAGFMDAIKTQIRDLNDFLSGRSANALAQSFGSGMTQIVNSLRGAADWVIKFRNEIMTMGELLAYVFAGSLAVSGVARLMTGFTLLTANVATLGQALMGLTPAALAAANAQRAIAVASGQAAATTGVFASAVGVLGFAVSRLLPQLAVIGIVASGVIAFFDLFGKSAEKADEQMRRFGATSQEELSKFAARTQQMRDEAAALQRSLDYYTRLTPRFARGSSSLLQEKQAELDALNQQIRDRESLFRAEQNSFQQDANERDAQSQMRRLADQEQRIRRTYDIARTEAAKQREADEKEATKLGRSIEVVRKEAQQRERLAQVSFYDDLAKIYEKAMTDADARIAEARAKNNGNEADVAERLKGAAASELLKIRAQQDAARAAALGVSMSPKVADEAKLMERGTTQLERLRANIVELRAELAGASGESAKLAYELEKIKFKDAGDNPAIQKLIADLLTAQAEFEKLDKLMNGQKKLSESLEAELKRLRDERFELENAGASVADKMLARIKRGDFEGITLDANGTIVRTAEAMSVFEKLANKPETKKSLDAVSEALATQRGHMEKTNAAARSVAQTLTSGFSGSKTAVESFNEALARTAGILDQIKNGASGFSVLDGLRGGFPGLRGAGVLPNGWTSGGDFGRFIDKLTGVESGGDPNAKNGNSSATGLGQFIRSTWLEFLHEMVPEATRGRSESELLALRNDPGLSRQATEWYARKNAAGLEMGGFSPTDANLYLSHFLGLSGALKTLRSDANTPIRDIVGEDAYNANRKRDGSFVYGETAGAVIAEIRRRFGDAVSVKGQAANNEPTNPVRVNSGPYREVAAAAQEEAKGLEKSNEALRRLQEEAKKTNNAKIADYLKQVDREALNAAERLEGAGNEVAKFREKVRAGEFGKENTNPDDPQFAEHIERLRQVDEAEKRLSEARKRRAAAENAIKQGDVATREAERRNADTRSRLGNLLGRDPSEDQSIALRRELDERLRLIEEHSGRESEAYKRMAAENARILESDYNSRASKRAAELAQENQTLARSLMNTTQQSQAKLRQEIAILQQELEQTKATGEAKVEIERQIAERIRLLRQQTAGSGPIAQAALQWADLGRNMEQAMVGWIDGGIDAIAEFVATGEMNFKKLLQSIVKDISKMGLRYLMSQFMGGAGGKAGKSGGAAGSGGKSIMQMFGAAHTGGIVGSPTMFRNVNPAVFAGAPRFHTGGIVGGLAAGEVPIIAKAGEGVFTPEQMAAMGGNNTAISQSVTVNVQGGSSGNPQDDEAFAERIGRRVQQELRGMVGSELRQQMRPGGILFAAAG